MDLRFITDPNPAAEYIGDIRLFKKSPKAPAAPDPVATAAAQTASNKETAYWNAALNNVNQITPYGTLSYTQTAGGKKYDDVGYNNALSSYNKMLAESNKYNQRYITDANGKQAENPNYNPNFYKNLTAPNRESYLISDAPPQFTSEIKLTPESQKLLDMQLSSENALASLGAEQIARIKQNVSSPYSYDSLGDAPTAQSIEQLSQKGQDALMARLNPQFGYDEEALRTRLINQGIGQNSEAYNREMDRFNQAKNDARTQAILQGANYGGTLQNQALERRNQAIQEYTAQRNAPLNEYTAMTSGAQIQNPTFQNTSYGGASPVDYAGLVNQNYQAKLGQYNSKVAGNNALTSSLFSLGGSALGSMGGDGGWLAALGL